MDNKFKSAFLLGGFIILLIVFSVFMPSIEENGDTLDYIDGEILTSGEEVVEEVMYVHIAGAVNNPGIIVAPVDARLYEVIEVAGGATEDADLDKVNLASIVSDAQKIIIPFVQVEENSYKYFIDNELVNINTANVEELETLDGIGESTAKKIIKYRDEVGFFKSIDELMNVAGIGEAKYNAIKDDITI